MRTTVFNNIECDYNRWRRHSAWAVSARNNLKTRTSLRPLSIFGGEDQSTSVADSELMFYHGTTFVGRMMDEKSLPFSKSLIYSTRIKKGYLIFYIDHCSQYKQQIKCSTVFFQNHIETFLYKRYLIIYNTKT